MRGWEIIIVAVLLLLLFGGKKIPELMKGLGKGIKSFKDGVNGIDERDQSGAHGNPEKTNEKKSETTPEEK